ncbi:MAG: hypothetical protein JWM27_3835 [Gemmatimonadetes bacterium]|nr:hypothetical protein [Gemmatimonadota bacterium]
MILEYVIGLVVATSLASGQGPAQERARLRVTQPHLVALCVDGGSVSATQRRWRVGAGEHTLAFTMRNDPRPGMGPDARPGQAVVRFRAEPGHRYEVEIRADALTYSRRVWKEREWKPVVRDRGTDTLVSSEPAWVEAGANPCR